MPRAADRTGVLAFLLSLPCIAGAQPFAGEPSTHVSNRFSSGVEIVALNVTVTNRRQQPVRGLTQQDFTVFEDGAPRKIALFGSGEVPIDLAILLDTSASVHPHMDKIRGAASGFLGTLRPGDRGAVIGFTSRVDVLQDWTADVRALRAAVERSAPGGGTSLFTALYVALRTFAGARVPDQVRRQAIVVLSDGEDTSSLLSFEDALDLCRRSGVSIYTIRLVRPVDRSRGLVAGRVAPGVTGEYALGAFARDTGGRAFTIASLGELSGTYASIAEELSSQYVIGYMPDAAGSIRSWRQIAVRLSRLPQATARTRSGYFAAEGVRVASRGE